MKKSLKTKATGSGLLFLNCLLVSIVMPTLALAREPIKLCFNNYPPYVIGNESTASTPIGLKVDVANEVFRRLDVPTSITTLPFNRCLKLIEVGRMDGALPLAQTDERRQYMTFSRAADYHAFKFIYQRSAFPRGLRWSSWDQISQRTLILNQGSTVDVTMEQAFAGHKPIMRSPDITLMVRMIAAGRGELAAADKLVAQRVIAQTELLDQLAVSEQSIIEKPAYFGLSKKSTYLELLPAINRELEKMHRDGSIARIMAKAPNY